MLCFCSNLPLQGSTISVRNLKVSLLARDTPAPVQQVLPPVLRPRVIERSFVMSIIERKFDGNPLTSGGFSVVPIIDDVSDDILVGKRRDFELGIMD
jgi:hypothetical protein